jgi:hypothetical protein
VEAGAQTTVIPPHRESGVTEPILVSDGRQLLLSSYFDIPAHDALSAQIDDGRRLAYIAHGLVHAGATPPRLRGPHVEFLVMLDASARPVASLRKVHALGLPSVWQLPVLAALQREDALTADGLSMLTAAAEHRPIVEVAGLWKERDYPSDVKLALYRRAVRDAAFRRELIVLGTVTREYKALCDLYGSTVVRPIGLPIRLREPGVSESVVLRAAVVDPVTLFADLLDDAEEAAHSGDEPTSLWRQQILWDMLRGFPWERLEPVLRDRLEELCPA